MTRRHSAFGSFTILNDSSTTLHSDSPDLPHHATHAHETRSSCFDHAAHSSSKDLRREHVVAEPRVQPTSLCRAASPAGASRQRATHVFAACRPRRAPSAACYRAGCWGVLQCSAFVLCFRANGLLFSAEFGWGCPINRRILPKNTNSPCSNHRK